MMALGGSPDVARWQRWNREARVEASVDQFINIANCEVRSCISSTAQMLSNGLPDI